MHTAVFMQAGTGPGPECSALYFAEVQGLFQSQRGRLRGANAAEEKLLSGLQAQQLKEFQCLQLHAQSL